jgi:pyruvate carboxylase subunit B
VKYIVDVNGERLTVDLTGDVANVDGTTVEAHATEVEGTPLRVIRIGTEVHRAVVRKGESRGRYTIWLDGFRYEVEALDERTRTIRDLSAASKVASGPAPLIAPMPGLIVRVMVEVGQAVHAGQGLVVMEAMKMENELRAGAAGTVKRVGAQPGTAVEKGTVLVELE